MDGQSERDCSELECSMPLILPLGWIRTSSALCKPSVVLMTKLCFVDFFAG